MKPLVRKHLDHHLPDWVRHDAEYFVTVCAEPKKMNQLCHPAVGSHVLNSVKHYHEMGKWFCHLAVLMPDHIHFLLNFPEIPSFSLVIGDWKRWLTMRHAISWQENFFEHRLRNEENVSQKAEYILQNPVRAGLVQDAQDWPYVWMPDSNGKVLLHLSR